MIGKDRILDRKCFCVRLCKDVSATMATNCDSDSDDDFNDDLLEPQVILDADEYQNTMSDDEDNQSSSSLLEVQIDDRSAECFREIRSTKKYRPLDWAFIPLTNHNVSKCVNIVSRCEELASCAPV